MIMKESLIGKEIFLNIYINGKGLNCDILRLRLDSNLFNDMQTLGIILSYFQ